MKTLLTAITAICLFTLTCSAQWTTSGTNIYNTNTGNVGVGTSTPTLGKFQINGSADVLTLASDGNVLQFNAWANNDFRIIQRTNAPMTLWTNSVERIRIDQNGNVGIGTTSPKARLHLNITGTSTDALQIGWDGTIDKGRWSINPFILGVANDGLAITDLTGGGSNVRMVISNAGNVGIGTTNPDQKLTVNGQVHSTSVVVTSSVPADYVFNADYDLRPLADVKAFVDKNHHLPEVPAAADFKKDGQNLGEMNMLLLKKVEELTLYMVEKDKQVKALQQKQAQLEKQLEQLINAKK